MCVYVCVCVCVCEAPRFRTFAAACVKRCWQPLWWERCQGCSCISMDSALYNMNCPVGHTKHMPLNKWGYHVSFSELVCLSMLTVYHEITHFTPSPCLCCRPSKEQHVPLAEYKANMDAIVHRLAPLFSAVVLITPPPVSDRGRKAWQVTVSLDMAVIRNFYNICHVLVGCAWGGALWLSWPLTLSLPLSANGWIKAWQVR